MTRLMVQDTTSGEVYVVEPDTGMASVALHKPRSVSLST